MVKLYEDREKGIVNAELFDTWAQQEAEKLRSLGLPPTQFRRFFGELRALEARIRSLGDDEEAFRKVKPYLNLLFAKVHYQTRDHKKAPAYEELERMLRDLFAGVETRKDFDVAMDAAQAVLAYFVPEQSKRKGG